MLVLECLRLVLLVCPDSHAAGARSRTTRDGFNQSTNGFNLFIV